MALTTVSLTGFGLVSFSGPASADPALDRVRERVAAVSEQVDALYREAEEANQRLLAAKVEHEKTAKVLSASKKAVEDQDAELATMTTEMGGFAAAAYRQGIVDPTLHLVLSDDPANALNESMMLDAYADQQAAGLAVVATERQTLLVKQADVEEQTAALAALEKIMADEQAELDSKVDEAEALLATLKEKEKRELERIEAEAAARAAAERAEAQRAAAEQAEAERTQRSQQQSARADSRQAPASASDGGAAAPAAPAPPPASGRGSAAVAFAMGQIGDYYAYGGTGPSAWDCSGLTGGAWAAAGVSVPRTSQAQLASLPRVSTSALQPGDIVAYYSGASHVGLYIGNGQIVHASRPGRPVSIAPVFSMPVVGAVRPG